MKKPRRARFLETVSALCQSRQRRASPHMYHNKRVPHSPRRTTGNNSGEVFSSFFFLKTEAVLSATRSSFAVLLSSARRSFLLFLQASLSNGARSVLVCLDVPCRALCLIETKVLWQPFDGVAGVWRWRPAGGWLRAARGLFFCKKWSLEDEGVHELLENAADVVDER